jgi:hypothetical protein
MGAEDRGEERASLSGGAMAGLPLQETDGCGWRQDKVMQHAVPDQAGRQCLLSLDVVVSWAVQL